ncbi:hypothetical protein [Noviherbaspirillum pedocola]|uniref:Uncharacterized protein n=1 Tax=Noviherbaspirillum pedocola TaxID=2801341 RepID=A0A934SZA8_9BURK|nr:hypothetical protein [Noviherbaspirillum pedocola]MBK4735737.1 hypothetical protein [Noviherbaspirillum pedocola]
MPSSMEKDAPDSPYANPQERRAEYAKRETEQKFSFIFWSPDESFSDPDAKSEQPRPGLSATVASMDNPEFVSAACESLLVLDKALARLAASGQTDAQAAGQDKDKRQALIAACLQTIQQHLSALLARNDAAPSASATATACVGAAGTSTAIGSSAAFFTTTGSHTLTLPSTPPASPRNATARTPGSSGPEQIFLSKVRSEVATIITEQFGPLLKELKGMLDKPKHRTNYGESSCTKALASFARISEQLMQASRCANAGDGIGCQSALRRAASALAEFRAQHLSRIVRLFPGADSPIPCRIERAFKEKLRDLASRIDALVDDPGAASPHTGRERATSSPMSPQRPKSEIAAPLGSPHESEPTLAAKRIRHFSANARTPRKLAREASRGKRGNDTPASSTPVPQSTAATRNADSASAAAPSPVASAASPRQHGVAPPSPRGALREKEHG